MAETSILDSVKKSLTMLPDNAAFDDVIIMHINAVFAMLNQLGIGPAAGFMIEDAVPTWADFLGEDPRLNTVKQYTYLRVKMLFDPPGGSWHLINAMKEQITELEWRISVKRENEEYVDPVPVRVDYDNVQYVPIPVNDFIDSE